MREMSLTGRMAARTPFAAPRCPVTLDPPGAQACGCLTDDQPEMLVMIAGGRRRCRCRRCGREWGEG